MTVIAKPYTFSPSTTISSSQVNANFDTLYNDYNGSISASNLAANAVTTAKIADGAVTTAKIADGAIKPNNLLASSSSLNTWAWDSWTPTWTNLTVGDGTVTAKYLQVGKLVACSLSLVCGTTTTVGTAPTFSLPVSASSTVQRNIAGHALDAGQTRYGLFGIVLGSTAAIFAWNASTTYLSQSDISSTVPFSWGASDEMHLDFVYDAA